MTKFDFKLLSNFANISIVIRPTSRAYSQYLAILCIHMVIEQPPIWSLALNLTVNDRKQHVEFEYVSWYMAIVGLKFSFRCWIFDKTLPHFLVFNHLLAWWRPLIRLTYNLGWKVILMHCSNHWRRLYFTMRFIHLTLLIIDQSSWLSFVDANWAICGPLLASYRLMETTERHQALTVPQYTRNVLQRCIERDPNAQGNWKLRQIQFI